MLWAVMCIDNPNTHEAREGLLKVHREYLATQESSIFFSGPLQTDDATASLGSLFIMNVRSRAEAQAFVDAEPFYRAGIFAHVHIYRMRKGRHNPHVLDIVLT